MADEATVQARPKLYFFDDGSREAEIFGKVLDSATDVDCTRINIEPSYNSEPYLEYGQIRAYTLDGMWGLLHSVSLAFKDKQEQSRRNRIHRPT